MGSERDALRDMTASRDRLAAKVGELALALALANERLPAQPSQAQQAEVTEAMVEALADAVLSEGWWPPDEIDMRNALTAALSARQGEGGE
jgi:hypothetical protein